MLPARDYIRRTDTLPKLAKLVALLSFCCTLGVLSQGAVSDPPASAASAHALVTQYCTMCHSDQLKTAGLSLESLHPEQVGPDARIWEKVLRKLKSGEMPPPKLPRPSPAAVSAFTGWLESELDHYAAEHPNPGHPTIHRLNRSEYGNAIRDLLALDIQIASKLPADDTGYGFDNIGDVLSLSPMLIDRYMSVSRLVSHLAVGDTVLKPETNRFDAPKEPQKSAASGRTRISDELPFDSAGGMAISYRFPVDGDYIIKIKTPAVAKDDFDGPRPDPQYFELRLPVQAGTRTVGVTFLGDATVPETVPGLKRISLEKNHPAIQTAHLDLRLDGARLKLYDVEYTGANPRFSNVTISGPYNIRGPGDTPSRERIFVCHPSGPNSEEPCARKILATLARRAYRRPCTDADLTPLLAFYQAGQKEGGFDHGIEMALRALLVSPDFLFRIEHDPPGSAPGTVHHVSDFELASRLSFFLWSSLPDDQLLDLAEQRKLSDPQVLAAQVDRMLEDRRSQAFVSNFAGQWLYLRNLAQVRPDEDAFPEYDPALRRAFQRETELFFASVLRDDRPITELLNANYTFLNQRLAEHYGIPNVYGPQFRRVALTDPNRGGLLGQGSILTVTSYPNRTSVVQRGKWVLENLLGTPPPPPPQVVPALEAHAKDGRLLTMRQQMEQHRANPVCASCHARMDPIGFALENYDGVGAWRWTEAGSKIDNTGKMPDGSTFSGPAGLKNLLLTKHRDDFISTFTEKLLTYALGRGVEYYDEPAIRAIVRQSAAENTSIRAVIHSIVNSPQFQTRRTPES